MLFSKNNWWNINFGFLKYLVQFCSEKLKYYFKNNIREYSYLLMYQHLLMDPYFI